MSAMGVLVTGAAGYLGSHVVRALRRAGYRVVAVDDLSTGHRAAVPAGAVFVEADAGDRAAMAALAQRERIAGAVHLAGAGGVGRAVPVDRANRVVTAAFAGACAEAGVARCVLTSSAAVYGTGAAPGGPRRPAPLGPYGASKLGAERALAERFAHGSCAVLRCFNLAGAGAGGARPPQAPGLVQAACEAALGLRDGLTVNGADWPTADGTCVRDYVHPADAARAHVAALALLERGGAPPGPLDCGRGRGHSVREVLAAVERAAGVRLILREGPRREGDAALAVADTGPIRRILGWRSRRSLDAMVADTLAWLAATRRCGRGYGRRRRCESAPA